MAAGAFAIEGPRSTSEARAQTKATPSQISAWVWGPMASQAAHSAAAVPNANAACPTAISAR